MQLFPLKLLPIKPEFDFVKNKTISCCISILLILISLTSIIVNKFNFGIDFIGGISMEVRIDQKPNLTDLREALSKLDVGEVIVQDLGTSKDLLIKVGVTNKQKINQHIGLIQQTLKNNFPYKFEYRKIDLVGPQIGQQIIRSGFISMLLALIAIMLYIWFRFTFYFGISILLTLLHDILLTIGFMSITRYDFNVGTIAAMLTVIGYSSNDSVVIYDRVRENLKRYANKTIYDIINLSINETLSRTTTTVFTTLLANLALIILGGQAMKNFSILVFVGICIGTYSSIFIATPILTWFNLQKI